MSTGPETALGIQMRAAAKKVYGSSLVVVKYHGNGFSEAGVSDFLCCLRGMFVAIEIKSPKTKYGRAGATVKQKAFGARIEKAGGIFAVCDSVPSFLACLEYVEKLVGRGINGHPTRTW